MPTRWWKPGGRHEHYKGEQRTSLKLSLLGSSTNHNIQHCSLPPTCIHYPKIYREFLHRMWAI